MAGRNITFYQGTKAAFNGLTTKDTNGIYFLTEDGKDIGEIYKGDKRYGGGDKLTIASSTALGGIKISDDFDISSDGTLKLYTPIAINSFSNNHPTNEIGSAITSATFSWGLNKVPTSVSISSGSLAQTGSNVQNGSLQFSFTSGIKSNTTFTLTATDAHNKTVTRTSAINFYHRKYYGVSSVSDASNVNNAFVLGLSNSDLVSGRTGSFTVNAGAGQYIWFAVPATFGTPSFFVGGFEGGFNLIKTFDLTNASGNVTSYNVYRSTNANLGNTTVEVK